MSIVFRNLIIVYKGIEKRMGTSIIVAQIVGFSHVIDALFGEEVTGMNKACFVRVRKGFRSSSYYTQLNIFFPRCA